MASLKGDTSSIPISDGSWHTGLIKMTSSAEAVDAAGQASNDQGAADKSPSRSWVHPLSDVISLSNLSTEPRLRTTLTCHSQSDTPVLYLPTDTVQMHSRSTGYIRTFAKANGFRLGRDRRNHQVQPINELRDRKPPLIALGLSLLLKQTGLPGTARTLSKPHALAPENDQIPLGKLIRMAAFATPSSKRVVVLPNRILINTLQDTQPICGYACKLQYSDKSTILSHFDSPYFRAIGYSSGSQYIVHICLAGGPREHSSLWTHIPTLTNTDFNFQLFPGRRPADDFGLFYITFYLDLADEPAPWWLQNKPSPDTHKAEQSEIPQEEHRKAS